MESSELVDGWRHKDVEGLDDDENLSDITSSPDPDSLVMPSREEQNADLEKIRAAFEIKLFHARREVPEELSTQQYAVLDFRRNWGIDVEIDVDFVDDELAMNPQVFARYAATRAKARRMRSKVKREIERVGAKIKKRLYEGVWREHTDPTKAPARVTEDYAKSYVLTMPSVIVLQAIYDDLDEAIILLEDAMTSLKMKQESINEIARNARIEGRLLSSDTVYSDRNRAKSDLEDRAEAYIDGPRKRGKPEKFAKAKDSCSLDERKEVRERPRE